jgi:hypothetical protein
MKVFRTSFLSLILLFPSVAFAPQLKHDAVGALLKKANLAEFLKTVGVWK